MESLYKTNINWYVFLIGASLMMLIPGIGILCYVAILISLYQFLLLFYSINYILPTRYIFGFMMCVQFFIGPALAYNGFDEYQYFLYRMQITETEYFSYAIPAVVCFILGLHIGGKLDGEFIDEEKISSFVDSRKELPFIMIGVGFLSSFVQSFFSSDLGFIFYLLAGFKFIGVFILIISKRRVRFGPMLLVYGSIISSSLGEGMFHDLITWVIFLGMVYCIRYKPSATLKTSIALSFLMVVTLIQVLKSDYRNAIGSGEESGVTTLSKAYEDRSAENKGGIFNIETLAPTFVRINQGFIITNIMKTVPAQVPFEMGEELRQIIEAALLPRILAPNKLKAGDREIFTKYSNIRLREGTSMGLSSIGDAYINFGIFGGAIFMFFLGLLYNFSLKQFKKRSKNFPLLLLFTPLVFYYPIRPDCELQTIMGHFFKSIFLIYIVMVFWRKYYKIDEPVLTY